VNLKSQRMLAAKVLKVGENRVWIDPEKVDAVQTAITRREIERLIRRGVIRARPEKGVSRGRAVALRRKRRLGRRKGPGSREGSKGSRLPSKRRWINTIRAIRRRLKALKEAKVLTGAHYRKVYMMAKGGAFKNSSHLMRYLESSGLLRRKLR